MSVILPGDDAYMNVLGFETYYFAHKDEFDSVGKKVYANFMAGSNGVQPLPVDMCELLEAALLKELPPITPFTHFMKRRFPLMGPSLHKLYSPVVARFLVETSYDVFTIRP